MLTAIPKVGSVTHECTCEVSDGDTVARIEVVSVGVANIDMVEKGVVTLLVRLQPNRFLSLVGRCLEFE